MHRKYDPCAPNPYFARHKYLGIPIDRSIVLVNECKLHHYVGPAAKLAKGIAVHILTPEHLWPSFQAEAEGIVTIDGQLTGNDEERNKVHRRLRDTGAAVSVPGRCRRWPRYLCSVGRAAACREES
ncbi:hypothetical protein [Massilia niabensis]|uniref:Uncharacterized protein n=1 Tax=Massilia niabensis TaxID=544910 RepID=A0ABW0LCD5_9BURK